MYKLKTICDNTLRDGEQMPGVYFSRAEKRELAHEISEIGVDLIDIMPAVSREESALVRQLVGEGLGKKLIASCMQRKGQVDLAAELGCTNIVLFSSLSDIQLRYKFETTREVALQKSLDMVEYAKARGLKVYFAGEDSTRADTNYLIDFVRKMQGKLEAFFLADTLGCMTPDKTTGLVREIKRRTNCKLLLHMHNDFGMATANTLAGLEAGADGFSGTFCGIGERAGNAALEEVIMGLELLHGGQTGIEKPKLLSLCRKVSSFSNVGIHPNKPWVGENAFAHESGTHAHAVIKNRLTYEYASPEIVGHKRRFVFGKHSGRGIIRHVLSKKFGEVSELSLVEFLDEVKTVSGREKRSFNESQLIRMFENYRRGEGEVVKGASGIHAL